MFQVIDPRDRELAKLLIHYSVKAKEGDLVYIHCIGESTLGLGAACAEEATRAGAAPYLQLTEPEIHRKYLLEAGEASLKRLAQYELAQMKDATCYLGLRGSDNVFETSDVPREKMDLYNKIVYKPVHLGVRVKETRWCVLRYPNSAMAQQAQKSREAFADFYYRVCCLDYAKMAEACKPLKERMEKTSEVRLSGPGTDLTFSIQGIPAIPCCGDMNIPDGECFTAPVRNSLQGKVAFNAPTIQDGRPFDSIRLEFKDGKVVQAVAGDAKQTAKLNEILDQDEGARFTGEWALGFHPHVLSPMRDILFDEKISGSFHFALGQCYDEAPNGNDSALHWDLVCIQRPDYGGGEIYFDGELVRKDGIFIPEDLKGLNPESLGGR